MHLLYMIVVLSVLPDGSTGISPIVALATNLTGCRIEAQTYQQQFHKVTCCKSIGLDGEQDDDCGDLLPEQP